MKTSSTFVEEELARERKMKEDEGRAGIQVSADSQAFREDIRN